MVFDPESAGVRLDDAARDGEAQAHAVRFRGEERFKYVGQLLLRDARAGIPHTYLDLLTFDAPGLHDEPSGLGRLLAHRVHGVEEQIQEHLLQLDPIAVHWRKAGRHIQGQLDLASKCVGTDQSRDFMQQLAQVQLGVLDFPPLQHGSYAVDYPPCPLIVPPNIGDGSPDFGDVGWIVLEEQLGGFSVTQDGTERLTQLMREGGGQLTHGRNPAGVSQLVAQFLQLVSQAFAFQGEGDPPVGPGPHQSAAQRDEQQPGAEAKPPGLPEERQHGEGKACAGLVPDAIVVGRPDAEDEVAGLQLIEADDATVLNILPIRAQSFQHELKSSLLRGAVAEGRVFKRQPISRNSPVCPQ